MPAVGGKNHELSQLNPRYAIRDTQYPSRNTKYELARRPARPPRRLADWRDTGHAPQPSTLVESPLQIRPFMQNKPNLVRLRRIQNPLFHKGLQKMTPPSTLTKTNPIYRGVACLPRPSPTRSRAGEAGTNPTCRGGALLPRRSAPRSRDGEAGTNPFKPNKVLLRPAGALVFNY